MEVSNETYSDREEVMGLDGEEDEVEPSTAILFPWFVQVLGLFVFFLLTRFVKWLPYTAVMFVLGTCMGVGAARLGDDNILSESISMWSDINSEVLLLVFLPGLVFKDALHVNFHLFTASISQVLLLAFPMVLGGTVLTACVAFYIFPYGWSWNLAMTFGSILSATDPVAVAALLAEVGAPPRLTIHITGESMLNDGSAMVFFNIFSAMFLYELLIPGLGEDITLGQGFLMFFQLALGGMCIGIAFALGLTFVLYNLDQRLNPENNVVQVAATVTTAYICYYTSEVISSCSGIIAVVICGIGTAAMGGGFINDNQMMEDFWGLLEHLLNTLLFTLGGLVWGGIIGNTDEREHFAGTDWGYLIILYILLMAIRFVSFGAFYPILSRVGIKTNWQESVFLCWGGLRGAVGIALALSLDNTVRSATSEEDEEIRSLATKLFGMVGGVAFFTLMINGISAGPLLKKLGLIKPTETKKILMEHLEKNLTNILVQNYAMLITKFDHFNGCFHSVQCHVPYLKNVSDEEILLARRHAEEHMAHLDKAQDEMRQSVSASVVRASSVMSTEAAMTKSTTSPSTTSIAKSPFGAKELRLLFLELLRGAYERATGEGFLDSRLDNGYLHYLLIQGVDMATDIVNRGGPIVGWDYSASSRLVFMLSRSKTDAKAKQDQRRIDMMKAYVFKGAHRAARKLLSAEFALGAAGEDSRLKEAAEQILVESKTEEQKATTFLESIKAAELEAFQAHHVALTLLNQAAMYITKDQKSGMVKGTDAAEYLETIEDAVREINACTGAHSVDGM